MESVFHNSVPLANVSDSKSPTFVEEVTSFRSNRDLVHTQNATSGELLKTNREAFSWRPGREYDDGHEFVSKRIRTVYTHPSVFISANSGSTYFRGFLDPRVGADVLVVPPIDRSYGDTAIQRTIPTAPSAGLAQFLGELREGKPRLPWDSNWLKVEANKFRLLGSEYLNVQFGWAPFIRDLIKMGQSVADMDKILHQYNRDSGRVVRRQYHFPPVRSQPIVTDYGIVARPLQSPYVGYTGASALYQGGSASGRVVSTTTSEERYWFSGAYTYYFPDARVRGNEFATFEASMAKLLGARLTPEVLWELAPWSWLVDWRLNIGTVIGNYTKFQNDRLLLRYGYLMRTTTVTTHTTVTGVRFNNFDPGPIQRITTVTQKERIRATPYRGFALNPAPLTTEQWYILGALGLTKSPKTLF